LLTIFPFLLFSAHNNNKDDDDVITLGFPPPPEWIPVEVEGWEEDVVVEEARVESAKGLRAGHGHPETGMAT
jgi:hypothetical protein